MNTIGWAIAALALAGAAAAQEVAPRTLTAGEIGSSLEHWSAFKADRQGFRADDGAKVARTDEAQSELRYTYEVTPETVRVLAYTRAMNLAGMKSARFRVRSSAATALVFGLSERDDRMYQTFFYAPAGQWQEVAVNLDELVLDDPAKAPGATLDPARVQGLHLSDLGHFLVSLVPELKGERQLTIEPIVFSSEPAPVTTGLYQTPAGQELFRVDNFESPMIRWTPLSLELAATPRVHVFDSPVTIDQAEAAAEGKGALHWRYPRRAGRAQGLLRNLERDDLSRATELRLWLRTERDGTFALSIQEKGGARYQQLIELKAADGWRRHSFPLSSLPLAEDSRDDNGRLDPGEIKEVSLADLTALLAGETGETNTLRVDAVEFTLRARP